MRKTHWLKRMSQKSKKQLEKDICQLFNNQCFDTSRFQTNRKREKEIVELKMEILFINYISLQPGKFTQKMLSTFSELQTKKLEIYIKKGFNVGIFLCRFGPKVVFCFAITDNLINIRFLPYLLIENVMQCKRDTNGLIHKIV